MSICFCYEILKPLLSPILTCLQQAGHTVYGLRLAFRLIGREDRAIRLPSIQRVKSLPSVFSRAELKQLIATPKWKKHRILYACIIQKSCIDCFLRQAGIRPTNLVRIQNGSVLN
jgi:integrase/recombinase XerD